MYNVYPSTPATSILLQIAHWTLLICLFMRKTDKSCKRICICFGIIFVDIEEEEEEEEEEELKEKMD